VDNNPNGNMGSMDQPVPDQEVPSTNLNPPAWTSEPASSEPMEMPSNMEAPAVQSEESQPVAVNSVQPTVNQPMEPTQTIDESQGSATQSFEPQGVAPSGSRVVIMIVVGLVIIIGSLIFLMWQGYIKFGGLEKYFTKNPVAIEDKNDDNRIVQPQPTEAQLRDTQRKSDLANIKTALKIYYSVKQNYPATSGLEKSSDEKTALKELLPNQISTLPIDPLSPQYFYGYKSDGKTYELTCVLEDRDDPSGTMAGTYFIYKVTESSSDTPVVNPTPVTEEQASGGNSSSNMLVQ